MFSQWALEWFLESLVCKRDKCGRSPAVATNALVSTIPTLPLSYQSYLLPYARLMPAHHLAQYLVEPRPVRVGQKYSPYDPQHSPVVVLRCLIGLMLACARVPQPRSPTVVEYSAAPVVLRRNMHQLLLQLACVRSHIVVGYCRWLLLSGARDEHVKQEHCAI